MHTCMHARAHSLNDIIDIAPLPLKQTCFPQIARKDSANAWLVYSN